MSQSFDSFDPDETIRYLLSLNRELTLDEINRATLRCGRNDAPWIVYAVSDRLPLAVAANVVPGAWSLAELPQTCLTQEMWRKLFERTGYTFDGKQAPRPTRPLTLYRGCGRAHRRRWSWTSDQATAEKFALRRSVQFSNGDEGDFLWRAKVAPHRLFAGIHSHGRREFEYVVDTRGLRIEPVHFGVMAARSRSRLVEAAIISPDRDVYPTCTDVEAQ